MVAWISLAWVGGCASAPEPLAPLRSAARCDDGDDDDEDAICDSSSRGELISVTPIDGYSKKGLDNYWDSWVNGLAAIGYVDPDVDPEVKKGADTYEIQYCSVDFDGTPILASGMAALPRKVNHAATVMYAHGTAVTRTDTPSNANVDEVFDGPSPMVIFAGGGYIYLAPDYTGFGASEAPRHRYFHAETEAAAELDLLTAVGDWDDYEDLANGDLFNLGFSQGGHTALAFAEAAESSGVDITATAVIGAVAEPDPWFDWLMDQTDDPYLQLYAADLIISYNDVYGDVYASPSDAFAFPYDETVEGLYDMNHSFLDVVYGLAGSTEELTTPDFYADLQDSSSVLRGHLVDNAVDDVCLDGPIQMHHSVDDGEVPFYLGEAAEAVLAGCNDVELVEWNGLDHLNTWHYSMGDIRDWFDTF